MREFKFGEIRPFLDQITRYSICFEETLRYENYDDIKDVPVEYEDLYVYGIGMICTEFFRDESGLVVGPASHPEIEKNGTLALLDAIEIVLSKEPREEAE